MFCRQVYYNIYTNIHTFVCDKEHFMNYIEVKFICTPNDEVVADVLSATIAEIGFESFVSTDEGVTAYIPSDIYNEDTLNEALGLFPLEAQITCVAEEIVGKDWNEEWEKNYFKPLIIDGKCIIQSTFHKEPATYQYNIIIEPKMAFGTGHHQTTELMIREMLSFDFDAKSVLDMGCGTAILAVLASMKGADPILAIDIDQWAYDNAVENTQLNGVNNIEIQIGGAELLQADLSFDVILANINRNILLQDIKAYSKVLNVGGVLFMSGFYEEDIPMIQAEAEKYGLRFCHHRTKENWAVVKFEK